MRINKKDIDMVVEVLNKFTLIVNPEIPKPLSNKYFIENKRKFATQILTKLKSNETILAKGKVRLSCDNRDYLIGDEITMPLAYTGGAVKEKLGKLEGKIVILKAEVLNE